LEEGWWGGYCIRYWRVLSVGVHGRCGNDMI
jgi:hypothetical protein